MMKFAFRVSKICLLASFIVAIAAPIFNYQNFLKTPGNNHLSDYVPSRGTERPPNKKSTIANGLFKSVYL